LRSLSFGTYYEYAVSEMTFECPSRLTAIAVAIASDFWGTELAIPDSVTSLALDRGERTRPLKVVEFGRGSSLASFKRFWQRTRVHRQACQRGRFGPVRFFIRFSEPVVKGFREW
jgi:hypothetical protein